MVIKQEINTNHVYLLLSLILIRPKMPKILIKIGSHTGAELKVVIKCNIFYD